MKYLTLNWFLNDDKEQSDKIFEEYARCFQSVSNKLPIKFLEIHKLMGFHDAIIKEIKIKLGSTATGHKIKMRVEDPADPSIVYTLVYHHVFDFKINRIDESKNVPIFKNMIILTDEILGEGDLLTHEILTDNYIFYVKFAKLKFDIS